MDPLMNNTKNAHSEKTNTSPGSTVFLLIIITAITKLFGFAREILFGRWYGVGTVAEAFKIAQTIPMLLLLIVGTGISTGFIPIYTRIKRDKGTPSANEFMSNLLTLLILFSITFCIIVTLFPGFFVKLFASGFGGSKFELTARYTQIAVWGTLFNMATYILTPYLQVNNKYLVPALMVIPGNLIFILCFYFGRSSNLYLVPFSIVLAIAVQLLWLMPFVLKLGYQWKFKIDIRDKEIRSFLYLAAPVIIGVAVNQLNIMVDKNIASFIMDGGVAILDYANRMTSFVQAIFIYPFSAVLFPKITKMIGDNLYESAKENTMNSLIFMAIIILPCSVGLMVYSDQIIQLLFGGEAFDQQALTLTGQAMLWYATGLFLWGWRDIMVRVYYAFGNTKIPTINSVIGVGINIILNLILSKYFGLNGLAIATSISGLITCLLMFYQLKRYDNFQLDYRRLGNRVFKILIATGVMGIAARTFYNPLLGFLGPTLGLMFAILAAISVFLLVILIVKIPELISVKSFILNKINRKTKN